MSLSPAYFAKLHERGLWDLFLVARLHPAAGTRSLAFSTSRMRGQRDVVARLGSTRRSVVERGQTGAEAVLMMMMFAFSTLLQQDPFIYKTLCSRLDCFTCEVCLV